MKTGDRVSVGGCCQRLEMKMLKVAVDGTK